MSRRTQFLSALAASAALLSVCIPAAYAQSDEEESAAVAASMAPTVFRSRGATAYVIGSPAAAEAPSSTAPAISLPSSNGSGFRTSPARPIPAPAAEPPAASEPVKAPAAQIPAPKPSTAAKEPEINVAGQRFQGQGLAVDGDTLWVGSQLVRLDGIDAPELDQTCESSGLKWRCGEKARQHLADLVDGKMIDCTATAPAGSGIAAICQTGGLRDISASMVSSGWAIVPTEITKDYAGLELESRQFQRGLWGSAFKAPWDWRADQADLQ